MNSKLHRKRTHIKDVQASNLVDILVAYSRQAQGDAQVALFSSTIAVTLAPCALFPQVAS